jgi:heme-degrading monooxygenase HmoA
MEGFQGAMLLRGDRADEVEFLVLTRWASMEAICAFAGDDVRNAVVEEQAEAALLCFRSHRSALRGRGRGFH